VKVGRARRNEQGKKHEYATPDDFRKLFTSEMSGLYTLSFLLTGDHEKAEQCFVAGLADCVKGNSVFKEWARSWAGRAIVQNAIRAIAPRPNGSSATPRVIDGRAGRTLTTIQRPQALIASILRMQDFERFVFALSVLERYPDHDCAILLSCLRQNVRESRLRALQQIAESHTKRAVAADRAETCSPEELIRDGWDCLLAEVSLETAVWSIGLDARV